MIELRGVEVEVVTEVGTLRGGLELGPGLNVFSAENSYGKSLAVTAIPWTLGLEPMFGMKNDDPSRFPGAVRDLVALADGREVKVLSSSARLTIKRGDGATISLERAIVGAQLDLVKVVEAFGDKPRTSMLRARTKTMSDETGGLQRFLYDWIGLPRTPLMTTNGTPSEIYLENIAPLFFIDQNEGWTDLQALQVHRYQLQEITEASVEFLLGARQALKARFARQEQGAIDAELKAQADRISERVDSFFRAQGWVVGWSSRGSPQDVSERWSKQSLSQLAKREFNMDAEAEGARLRDRVKALSDALVQVPAGDGDLAPASHASQQVVDLKNRRHVMRSDLRDARMQHADQTSLLSTIEHRLRSSEDVLRLKVQGIGRLDVVECPTCHRDLDPSTFSLTVQSTETVAAHIEALKKQRNLFRGNITALEKATARLQHDLSRVEEELIASERSLATVNQAQGTMREQLAKVAADLIAAEHELDLLAVYRRDMEELEVEIKRWLEKVRDVTTIDADPADLRDRLLIFEQKLREQLLALGHSAVKSSSVEGVHLDERYTPYLGPRRLRSLGSASDHSRLVQRRRDGIKYLDGVFCNGETLKDDEDKGRTMAVA